MSVANPLGLQVKVFISPEAWDGLLTLARRSSYLGPQSTVGRGIGQYMHALFAINHTRIYTPETPPIFIARAGGGFIDNRPDYLRSGQHPDLMPTWVMSDQFTHERRIPRCFKRQSLPLDLMHRLAIMGGITLPQFKVKEPLTPSTFPFDSTTRSASAVMEVIGRLLLTPYNTPRNPLPVSARMRRTFNEVAW